MTIYKPDHDPLMTIEVDDESYHFAEIMGRNDVTLYFSLPQFVDFPVGCYITYMANTYTLYSVDKMRMEHRRDYEYTLTLESEASLLDQYIFTNPNDGRFKFPLTANSGEHLMMLCECLSEKTGETWTVGNTVDAGDKPISYDAMTCLDALKQMADTFETEYSINGTTISLGKVEYYTNLQDQVRISYGKGNGLRPGVEKLHDDSEKVIGKVYIQGGERNIDFSQYGSATLLLHPSRTWYYDGTTLSGTSFPGALEFRTSSDGRYLELIGDDVTNAEGALDLSDIYPYFEHTVSSVEEVDVTNHFWDIYSNTFTAGESSSAAINYGESLIANGEDMTIIFQSGQLAGREFGVKWQTKDVSGSTVAYMEIVPSEQDGYTMPDRPSGFYPSAGDTFRVFNVYLPHSYIDTAESTMRDQALSYLWEHCREKFSIKGEIDPIWSASRWLNIGGKFKPGAYFRFTDPTWETDGVSIRITSIKTFINKPHCPIVEMSNSISKQGVTTALKKMEADANVLPQTFNKDSKAFTKRTFADAKETMEMLINAGLDNFSQAISPIAVQTMQLLVGDESLQFLFWTNRNCTVAVSNPFTYNASTKQLTAIQCALQHMTLGIKDIKPSSTRSIEEYKRWNMAAYESAVLDDPSKHYYVYAKCDADNPTTGHLGGVFYLSEQSITMGPHTETEGGVTTDYYYFLCGMLNSERDGDRSFAPMFGFSEVLPGQITTDVIRGASGTSWWDLTLNQLYIGGKLTYSPSNGLVLNNALVQTGNNTTTVIGAWCGEYDDTRTYKLGDEVWVEDANGIISTYRWIADTPDYGIDPPDDDYWQVTAEGKMGRGISGSPIDKYWYQSEEDGQNPPSGPEINWRNSRPPEANITAGEYIWKRTRFTYSDNTTSDTYTSEYCPKNGTDGTDGPWLNSRGNWSSGELYVGDETSCDVVYYNGKWYKAKKDAGEIPVGTYPTNTTYWVAFESNFSNIATGLLFVEREYVNNLYVRDLETMSSPYNGSIRATDNYLMMVDELNQPKLLITGNDLPSLSNASGDTGSWRDGYGSASGGTVTVNDYVAQISVSQTENNVSFPNNTITIARGSGSGQTTAEEAVMTASYVVDSTVVSSVSKEFTFDVGETEKTFTLPKTNRRVTTGNHQIYIRITASTPSSNNLSRASYSAGSVEVTYPNEAVQIGANGFRAAFSPTSYASFTKESGSVNYTIRNGNYGIQVASTGIKMTFNGSTWYTASRDASGNLVLLSD